MDSLGPNACLGWDYVSIFNALYTYPPPLSDDSIVSDDSVSSIVCLHPSLQSSLTLQYGADTAVEDARGATAVDVASSHGHGPCVELLTSVPATPMRAVDAHRFVPDSVAPTPVYATLARNSLIA
jgi:hypothetical protein